ncbi:hypothetical protein GEV43_00060 [Actinomadura sp. J1-007]|nr:hypothetical protein [Actinomadura sp. J1-007]
MRSKPELQSAIRDGGRAVLLVNVRSRRGRRLYGTARRMLREAGLEFAQVFPVNDPSRLRELFADALALEPDLVVVGGGDGTVAEAVTHLAHRDVALGVLPLGTTNNFARSLELPLDLAGAVRTLRDGKVADVDVGWFESTVPRPEPRRRPGPATATATRSRRAPPAPAPRRWTGRRRPRRSRARPPAARTCGTSSPTWSASACRCGWPSTCRTG